MREVQELCRKYYLTHGVWFVDEQFPQQTQKPPDLEDQ
jgi:hypothetical protein